MPTATFPKSNCERVLKVTEGQESVYIDVPPNRTEAEFAQPSDTYKLTLSTGNTVLGWALFDSGNTPLKSDGVSISLKKNSVLVVEEVDTSPAALAEKFEEATPEEFKPPAKRRGRPPKQKDNES